jgi:DNA-binding SARP family transcriptional activator
MSEEGRRGRPYLLAVELLGGFRVTAHGADVPAESWRRRKPAALIKLLALAPRRRLHREQVMDALWPELGPAAEAANLRKALHHARRALGDEALIVSDGDFLALPGDTWVDVDAFRAALAEARRGGDAVAYARAIELYREGLLPDDRYDDWVLAPRDELHADYVAAVEELGTLLEAAGDVEGATRAVRRLIAAEPLREDAHARLMRLHALAGRRSEALREYERLSDLLARELDAEPSPETQRLYEEIRLRQADEPELGAELWERVGDLRMLAGDAAGAAKAFGSALEAADSADAQARLRRKTAGAWLMGQRPEEAEPELQAAERLAAGAAEQARLVGLRATQAWQRGDIESATALAEQARGEAEAYGDADDVAAAYECVAVVSHFRGAWREGVEHELMRLPTGGAAQLGRVFDIHHCIGQYHLYGDGLTDDVEDYARRTLDLAEEAGAERAQAFAWCLLGESLLLQARWDESAGCLERSCELHATFGSRSGALPWQRLAELVVSRGAPGDADGYLRRASAIATVSPMARHMWGRIHATSAFASLERGDPEGAAQAVRAAAAAATRYGDCPTCGALLNPIAAETFCALGDPDAARPYAEAAAGVAAIFQSSAWSAMAESAAASVARADGDAEGAHARFGEAARLYERARQPFWAERSAGNAQGTGPS